MSKKHAATYRRLARGAERLEKLGMDTGDRHAQTADSQSPFTCNAVGGALGDDECVTYQMMFIDDERNLWDQPDCPSIRVLMLCFAAAMAETGDL